MNLPDRSQRASSLVQHYFLDLRPPQSPRMPPDGFSSRPLLPPMASPPPPKRHKSESTPASDVGRSRYYHSQSVPSSERAQSRQTSTAMDIYVITDRDPAERDRRYGRFTSNGSVASHSSQVSHASRSSPPMIISNRKYVLNAHAASLSFLLFLASRMLSGCSVTDNIPRSQNPREVSATYREWAPVPRVSQRHLHASV